MQLLPFDLNWTPIIEGVTLSSSQCIYSWESLSKVSNLLRSQSETRSRTHRQLVSGKVTRLRPDRKKNSQELSSKLFILEQNLIIYDYIC